MRYLIACSEITVALRVGVEVHVPCERAPRLMACIDPESVCFRLRGIYRRLAAFFDHFLPEGSTAQFLNLEFLDGLGANHHGGITQLGKQQ